MSAAAPGAETSPVAIVCGAGAFPYVVADAVLAQGRRAVLFGLRGFADPSAIARYSPHHWCHVGQLGRFRRLAHGEGCKQVVMIGGLVRPSIAQLRFDVTTLRMLPRIISAYQGGDKHLLAGVGQIVEHLGFTIVGAHELAPQLLVPEGVLGRYKPDAGDVADMAQGFALLAALGRFDIGQAAVMAKRRVIAVEAAEGTDGMLARVAALRRDGLLRLPSKVGVLVKAPKLDQDRRLDLPSVGRRTVEGVAAAGLAGIALEAGGAISADLQDMIRAADAAGLFIVGVAASAPSPVSAPPLAP